MAGESQQVPEGKPDPTVMTTELIDRAVQSAMATTEEKLNTLRERLNGIDTATQLRIGTIDHLPAVVDVKVGHLAEMMHVELAAIAQQFAERDVRSERESKDNVKAVDAAFAAQKEAAAKQDESNQKSIDKTERQFNETINKMAELFKTTTDGLARQMNDKFDAFARQLNENKSTIDRYEARQNGGNEQRTEHRQSNAAFYATVGMGLTLILAAITIIGFIAANSPN